jgi:hypothetical protein
MPDPDRPHVKDGATNYCLGVRHVAGYSRLTGAISHSGSNAKLDQVRLRKRSTLEI